MRGICKRAPNVPVYAVRGNNDRVHPLEPKEQLIPLEDTYIYMTHGHEVSYDKRIQELVHVGQRMGHVSSYAGTVIFVKRNF